VAGSLFPISLWAFAVGRPDPTQNGLASDSEPVSEESFLIERFG